MLSRLINTALILFFSINCFTQLDRAKIIENKIRSVKTTTYLQGDSLNREVEQRIYSKAGNDSIIFINGILSSKFVATTDAIGRVSRLERFDSKDSIDEVHMYTYNKNGSYSIEIIAQGAGRISLAQYNKKNICMEEEIDASYTLVYVRNASGKIEKILSKEDGKTETIAVFYFDKNGLATWGEGTTEGGEKVYFKYNDKKLVSEIKTIGKNEDSNREETEIMIIEYEFYENPS